MPLAKFEFPDSKESKLILRLLLISGILLVPALLINLGKIPPFFHTDESRRAVVALEMLLSGDYLTPTINGNLYFNKPPVYNWVIAGFFAVFNSYSVFVLRLPAVLGALLYGFFIYRFTFEFKQSKVLALFAALATITTGRILFYDSFIGLIDLSYAALTFLNFMLIFRYGSKEAWYKLFTISYSLMALTFLMKGFTAIVFEGISILTFLISTKNFRKLYSPAHFSGIAVGGLILATYYWFYLSANDLFIKDIFSILWDESAKRTPAANGALDVVIHFLQFPFEFIYTFFPWTLLGVLFFIKSVRRAVWQDSFFRYCLLLFFANISVYWISPGTMPRYLFPILALLIIPLGAAYMQVDQTSSKLKKAFEWLCFALLSVIAVLIWFVPFDHQTSAIDYGLLVAIALSLTLVGLLIFYFRNPILRPALIVLSLIVVRIGFSWFVLPARANKLDHLNQDALKVVELTQGQNLFLYRLHTSPEPNTYLHNSFTYVIEAEREEILQLVRQKNQQDFFLVGDRELKGEKYNVYYTFISEDVHPVYLVKFSE